MNNCIFKKICKILEDFYYLFFKMKLNIRKLIFSVFFISLVSMVVLGSPKILMKEN